MKIVSLSNTIGPKSGLFDLFTPAWFNLSGRDGLLEYTVEPDQEMRMDLVILSMYEQDPGMLQHMDIICFLNGIDNPLNVYPGMKLYYPDYENINNYRLSISKQKSNDKVKARLAVPNKTTKTDPNRKKFIDNGFSLPPTVKAVPSEPVIIEGNQLKIGGL